MPNSKADRIIKEIRGFILHKEKNRDKNSRLKLALILSIIGCLPIFFFMIFRWYLIGVTGFFVEMFLEPLAILLLLTTCLTTLIFFIIKFIKYRQLNVIYPFLIAFLTFSIYISGLDARIAQYANFQRYYKERVQVVKLIETDKLRAKANALDSSLVDLPARYKHLSASGGEVVVAKEEGGKAVLFYFYRGYNAFSGFIYKQSDIPPHPGDQFAAIEYWLVKKLKPNWYLVAGD